MPLTVSALDNPRALFQLFLFFDEEVGLPSIVKRVAFREPDPRQIYQVVLGRLPETAAMCVVRPDYSPAAQLTNALHSAEFQNGLVTLFSNAFPEKRRRFFIHIPKCAGTDLIAYLMPRYPSIGWTLTREEWTSKEALFSRISVLVREVLVSADLFIHGHMNLQWVLNQKLLRRNDEIFTMVRDPADMVMSQVNYIITKLVESAARPGGAFGPEIRKYLRVLEMERFEPNPSPSVLLSLAKRILREPALVPHNRLCRSFGPVKGQEGPSAQAAYDTLIIANPEITDTQRYARWLQSKFGIVSKTRRNVSRAVLTRETLSADETEYVESIITEDRKIYDRIQAALATSDAPSVMADKLDPSSV